MCVDMSVDTVVLFCFDTRLVLMVCHKQLRMGCHHFVQAEHEPALAAHHLDGTASDTGLRYACRCCFLTNRAWVVRHGHLLNLLRSHSHQEGHSHNSVH